MEGNEGGQLLPFLLCALKCEKKKKERGREEERERQVRCGNIVYIRCIHMLFSR